MNTLQTFLAAGAVQASPVYNEPFTLDGGNYSGPMSERNALDPATPTGFESTRELVIVVLQSAFTAAPNADATKPRPPVTARGATWFLVNVETDAVSYILTCRPQTP